MLLRTEYGDPIEFSPKYSRLIYKNQQIADLRGIGCPMALSVDRLKPALLRFRRYRAIPLCQSRRVEAGGYPSSILKPTSAKNMANTLFRESVGKL